MSVHMVRFRCSPDADAYLIESYLPQWLTTHTAWSEGWTNKPPVLKDNSEYGESDYYAADWYFAWGDPDG